MTEFEDLIVPNTNIFLSIPCSLSVSFISMNNEVVNNNYNHNQVIAKNKEFGCWHRSSVYRTFYFLSDNAGVIVNVKGEMKGKMNISHIFCLVSYIRLV